MNDSPAPSRWRDAHLPTLIASLIGAAALIVAAIIGAQAARNRDTYEQETARLRDEITKRDIQIATIQAQLLASRSSSDIEPIRPSRSTNSDIVAGHSDTNVTAPRNQSQVPVVAASLVGTPAKQISSPATRTESVPTDRAIAITDMSIVEGRVVRKTNSVVFGEVRRDALFFPAEKIAVRTGRMYERLVMSVGIQDNEDARGSKRFWVRDERDDVLFEGHAKAGYPPVQVDIDVSHCERISFNALDYNGQTPEFVRWLDVKFIRKP